MALLLFATPALAGPRIKPSAPDPTARFSTGTVERADQPDTWWTTFGDPALDALVAEAIEVNHDLGGAQARIHSAQGVVVQNLAPLLPTASFDVGLNASPSANVANQIAPQQAALFSDLYKLLGYTSQLPNAPEFESLSGDPDDDGAEDDPDVTWNGSAAFNFGLNIDFGRSAFAFKAAQLDAAAARGDRDGVARIVVQQVVGAWLDVRTARARIAVIEQQIATNEILLDITRRRFVGGDSRGLDVLQQQQQLAGTKALLPQAKQLLRLRTLQLAHPFAAQSSLLKGWNMETRAFPGTAASVACADYDWTAEEWTVGFMASMRLVMPLDDFDQSTFVHPGGPSGQPKSPFYRSHYDAFVDGGTTPFPFSEEAVRAATVHTLVLQP